jgi:hypothetical protein
MVQSDTLKVVAQEEDEVLAQLVSLIVRRRTAGFTPVLLVSVNDDKQVISDFSIELDDVEDLVAFLHHSGIAGADDGDTSVN